ncbi:hypothetical protein E2C01_054551 [Portunus trituberculatus]|uniref:Uncharacterized protein n=1 Tax=Portunus trituberculatus TaxID=210409 RepID=A0A5B7GVB9_PORTR|nr:hypothetical protein [Portunus trituberculatus]
MGQRVLGPPSLASPCFCRLCSDLATVSSTKCCSCCWCWWSACVLNLTKPESLKSMDEGRGGPLWPVAGWEGQSRAEPLWAGPWLHSRWMSEVAECSVADLRIEGRLCVMRTVLARRAGTWARASWYTPLPRACNVKFLTAWLVWHTAGNTSSTRSVAATLAHDPHRRHDSAASRRGSPFRCCLFAGELPATSREVAPSSTHISTSSMRQVVW